MTTNPSLLRIMFIGLISSVSSLCGEEILLHTGPPVLTPASTPVSPFPQSDESKMIKFQREFFINRELLLTLPESSSEFGSVPISAIEAIKLATKNIDPQTGLRSLILTEIRLLKKSASSNKQIEYYLVSALANGSEYHRVVLMNGHVISSRLREIKE